MNIDNEVYASIFYHCGNAMAVVDNDMTVLLTNNGFEKLTGLTASNIKNNEELKVFIKANHEMREIISGYKKQQNENEQAAKTYELHLVNLDGSVKDIRMLIAIIPGHENYILTLIDITEEKQAEKNLLNTNRQLEDIIEFLPDATMIVNNEGKITAWNKAIEEMSGIPKRDMIGKDKSNVTINFYGTARPFLLDMINPESEALPDYEYVEHRSEVVFGESFAPVLYNNKGAYIWAIASYLKDGNGNIIGAIESVRDVSRYRIAEKALSVNEELYRNLYNNNPSMYFTIDTEGEILSVNKFGCEQLGYSQEEITGSSAYNYFHKEDLNKALSYIELCTKNIGQVFNWEIRKIKKSGTIFWVKETARALWNSENKIIIFIVNEDITERKRAEDFLQESEKKYRQLVNNSFAGIYIIQNNIVKFCNQKFIESFGYSELREVLGMHYRNLIAPESWSLVENEIILRESGIKESGQYECKGKKSDGSLFDVEVLACRIIYEGEIATQGTLIDISERKRSEKEINKLTRAVEQNPSAIVITDLYGIIEYVNPSFEKITGYSFDEVKGKNSRVLKDQLTDDNIFTPLWNKIIRGNEWRGEFRNTRKNGEVFWEAVSISAIKNEKGEITNFISVEEDITAKKELELELKRAVDRAEESNRLKTSLLSNMSHELRTPLNGILGLSQILMNELSDSSFSNYIKKIYFSGRRLMITLNSILDLSEIESNTTQINIIPYDLASIIPFLLAQYSYTAKEKGLAFDIEIAASRLLAFTDERLCNQIILNLIDNAVKYTENGGIRIVIESETISDETFMKISVIDTGIGISEENIPLIFEEFRQVSEGYNRSFEGSGLGLTLVKKMLELLDGEISVESKIGTGSKFIVYLPSIEKTDMKEGKPPAVDEVESNEITEASESNKPKVLLVEDNEINMEVIICYIEDFCDVDFTGNGADAVIMVRNDKYDLILMDINLGNGMDGVAATKEIRKIEGYENTPVVALTGYAMSGDKEKLLSEGLTHYLAKPFERNELRHLIKNIIEEKDVIV